MQNALERRSKTRTRSVTRAESVHARSRDVRRQLMTLAKVYEQADPYYRAALRPIIKTVLGEET